MSETLLVPGVTGRVRLDADSYFLALMEDEPTGFEYGDVYSSWQILISMWRDPELPFVPEGEQRPGLSALQARAAALAVESPHVASSVPATIRLSGNLAEDVHLVTGLTWRQIADIFRISERAVAGWRRQGVPRHRVETMQALRAIGATLYGGLGAPGVSEWLLAGSPSRVERVRDGDAEAVSAEAIGYLDTPAT
jgi:hypothetical protein